MSTAAKAFTIAQGRLSRMDSASASVCRFSPSFGSAVENSSSRDKNAEKLKRVLPELIIWPVTESAAQQYGKIAAELRKRGRSIGKMDMLIAAIAISLGKTTVVSGDSDLTAVAELNVENWGV